MIQKIKLITSTVEKILLSIAIVSLVVCVFSVALDVFARNVHFVSTILWGQEIAMMAFIWSVFSGGAVTFRKQEHFKIEVLSSNIRHSNFIKSIILIIALLFSCILLKEGFSLSTTIGLQRGSRPSGIPLFWVFLSIPIAGFSMILFTIEQFVDLYFKQTNKGHIPL